MSIYEHLDTFQLGVSAKQVVRVDVDVEDRFEKQVLPALSKLLELRSSS